MAPTEVANNDHPKGSESRDQGKDAGARHVDGDKDGDGKRSPRETLREGWMAVLGAVSTAEEKGLAWILELAGVTHEKGGDVRAEIAQHVRKNRETLEKRVEDGVKQTFAKMRVPIDKEIVALRARIEKIQSRMDGLRRRNGAKAAPSEKPGASPSTDKKA